MEKEEKKEPGTASPLHEFKTAGGSSIKLSKNVLTFFVGAAVVGVLVGYLFSPRGAASGLTTMNSSTGSSGSNAEGSNDLSTFKDTAEGTLQNGGIDGEGQYHLVRPGGDSQNVYLVSSVVDLSKYVGKKIKVWGQTQSAQKAGWLMDVGRVQAL